MNLKKVLLSVLVICFSISAILFCGFSFFKKDKSVNEEKQSQVTNVSAMPPNVWCVTFQLVWNDFMDKFSDGKPIIFENGNPPIADELNKKLYTSDILSDESYYKVQGLISQKLKNEIEKNIYKKFKEKSDILSLIDWNNKNTYLFYVMLKKNFTFLTAFDNLPSAKFNKSENNVKYFGVDTKSSKKLHENIDVLFYKNSNEYAVRLLTKENEDVILYRTDSEDSFENLYSYVMANRTFDEFEKKDILQVPYIEVDKTVSYDELCGKKLKDKDIIISKALQTIKFKMDNKGGSLKSEAAIAVMKTALRPEAKKPRYFLFDKRFVLFLKETDKEKPYYAMIVDNTDYLVKE